MGQNPHPAHLAHRGASATSPVAPQYHVFVACRKLVVLLILAAAALRAQSADLILRHARIVTVDPHFRIADSIAIRGDRILAVGNRADCLPFNFDADLGSIGGDRDVGFSFDPLKNINIDVNIQIRPLFELLAFVGLQRFRPMRVRSENRFRYSLWFDCLVPELAAAAACGLLELPNSSVFEFRLLYRTKYLKSFLPSKPVSRSAL